MFRSNMEPTSWGLGGQVCVSNGALDLSPGPLSWESLLWGCSEVSCHRPPYGIVPRSARRAPPNQNVLECDVAASGDRVGGQPSARKAGAHLCGDVGPQSTGQPGQRHRLLLGCRARGGGGQVPSVVEQPPPVGRPRGLSTQY